MITAKCHTNIKHKITNLCAKQKQTKKKDYPCTKPKKQQNKKTKKTSETKNREIQRKKQLT